MSDTVCVVVETVFLNNPKFSFQICDPMLSHVGAVEDLRITIIFGSIVCCQISVLDITPDWLAQFVKLGAQARRLECRFCDLHIMIYHPHF